MADRQILIVDDDPFMRALLVSAIEHPVATAAGVFEAKTLLNLHSFDLVISDLNLEDPEGDGVSVLLTARAVQPSARRCLVTGQPDDRCVRAVSVGLAESVLRKPWSLADLRRLIG